jgi:phosphatidylglycerol:prolipoprotein diacylglycerol transferase
MFPIIQIGPLSLPAPGLILLAGIWIGLTVAERLAPKYQANPNHLNNLVFILLISGLVGARLSYIAQHLNAFIQSPISVVSLNPGLLDPLGGAAVALIVGIIYVDRKGIPVWSTLDALTPFLSVMWIALGLSNLASGRAFGIETQLPWGIDLWGAVRHPTQVYQMMAGIVILTAIWPRKNKYSTFSNVSGKTFWIFLTLSASAWMLIETFRGDSILLPGGIRMAQVVAWGVLAISLWGLGRVRKKSVSLEASV